MQSEITGYIVLKAVKQSDSQSDMQTDRQTVSQSDSQSDSQTICLFNLFVWLFVDHSNLSTQGLCVQPSTFFFRAILTQVAGYLNT